jgi:hypothetical protein
MLDEFYNRAQGDAQSYMLVLDFRKAFDSVQHEFILAAARHQGMPEWFVKIFQGLFHGATATPVLFCLGTIPWRECGNSPIGVEQ